MALNDFTLEKDSTFTIAAKELEFGGDNDLFGADEITKDDIADPNFEIKYQADAPAGKSLQVDSVIVEVFYTIELDEYDPTGILPWAPSPYADAAVGTPNGVATLVIVGFGGILQYSINGGVTWNAANSGVADTLWGVTYADDQFIAVGENGTLITSPDGINWTRQQSGTTEHLFSPIYDRVNEKLVVVGKNENKVTKGINEANWSVRV